MRVVTINYIRGIKMSNQTQNQKKEPNLLLMAIGFLMIGFGIVILLSGIRINVDTSEV